MASVTLESKKGKIIGIAAFIFLLFLNLSHSFASQDHSLIGSSFECLQCHPRASPNHPLARPQKMTAPLPLDASGNMSCLTCHNCVSGTCVLWRESADLCKVCHDCTKGMGCVIGVVHLGSSQNIKELVRECRVCHDGMQGLNIGSLKDHKIDVLYIPGPDFKIIDYTPVVLVDGRVTCISCHNPYSNDVSRLVISDQNSRLCLTCHRK